MRANFLTSPHSHTRTQRVSSYAQGWRDQQRSPEHVRAMSGFLNAAVAGAILWAVFGGLLAILWGVMS
jgi:hypothetical protein